MALRGLIAAAMLLGFAAPADAEEGLPDLLVPILAMDPPSPRPGERSTITAIAENAGDARSPAARYQFRLNGDWFEDGPLPGLPPGGQVVLTTSIMVNLDLRGARNTLSLALDTRGDVEEPDEGNNERFLAFRLDVPPLPDLRLAAVRASPPDPSPGDAVRVVALVVNDGTVAARATTLHVGVDYRESLWASLPPLGPGEAAEVVTTAWTANNGLLPFAARHQLRVLADAAYEVPEEREGNNRFTLGITVAPAAAAVAALGDARGAVAASALGGATGYVAASGAGTAQGVVAGGAVAGDARAILVAVSVFGDASASSCLFLGSPMTGAFCGDDEEAWCMMPIIQFDWPWCHGLAASATGDADGYTAVSVTGHAEGAQAVSGCDALAAQGFSQACVDPV